MAIAIHPVVILLAEYCSHFWKFSTFHGSRSKNI